MLASDRVVNGELGVAILLRRHPRTHFFPSFLFEAQGFVTNHLMLKAVKNKEWALAYMNLIQAMVEDYFGVIDFVALATLEAHTVRTLAFLFLARMDGKSPAEYITADGDKQFIRKVSRAMVRDNLKSYEQVVDLMLHSIGKSKVTYVHAN